ncbi:hypothetical protein [Glaciibacter psychrotolerans]|uniref:Uncharacterized protein n=1 Tax=Glaciibacter psychrotolerans TaxID=670054 RepID=A0A7Z0EIL2_9MICO|nr:hypothetical protein [Leifsonia psychrotolerans]NYJ21542.1 hypothetical protein [Leifsonia psychrotolerans]
MSETTPDKSTTPAEADSRASAADAIETVEPVVEPQPRVFAPAPVGPEDMTDTSDLNDALFPAPVAAGSVAHETFVPAMAEPPAGEAPVVPEESAAHREGPAPVSRAVEGESTAHVDAPDPIDSREVLVAPRVIDTPAAVYTPALTVAPQRTADQLPTPIYVQAPTPPTPAGNRGGGILIALLATVAYAALFSVVAFLIVGITSSTVEQAVSAFSGFVVRPVFYIPVIFFFIAFSLLIAIVNRGGWWNYVFFGFLVAVVVYFSYIGGALLTVNAWNYTPREAAQFIGTQWLNPGAIASAIIAREVPIWFGAWIAARGRKVSARNIEARQEYDRLLAEGPQLATSL